jgi:hypothetical protein
VQSLDTDDPKRPFCLENQGSLVGTHLATRGPNEAPEEEEWWSCATFLPSVSVVFWSLR